jgi:predicted O-methyltransferase YrrM
MDAARFVSTLPAIFTAFPSSEHPLDRRYGRIVDEVGGLTRENNLALIGHAASLLAPGECYVEVGTYRGASLLAALVGNPAAHAVAIDSFDFREGSREGVEASLERFGLAGRAEIVAGDAFEVVPAGALAGRRVGVWYYDALHTYEAQLEGLRIAEPHLAPGALIVVDDTDWEQVGRAVDDYLAGQPRARRVLSIDGKERGQPQWWEGVEVLAWTGEDRASTPAAATSPRR